MTLDLPVEEFVGEPGNTPQICRHLDVSGIGYVDGDEKRIEGAGFDETIRTAARIEGAITTIGSVLQAAPRRRRSCQDQVTQIWYRGVHELSF